MKNRDLKATLSAFMEHLWNKGDFSQIATYVAAEYAIKSDPGDPWDGQVIDHAGFKERVLFSRNAFPDLRFDLEELIAEGDRVVASWIMSGTHLGDLPGLPATGKPFAIRGMTIYYFKGDKVCGHWQAYDRLGFLAQMGVLRG